MKGRGERDSFDAESGLSWAASQRGRPPWGLSPETRRRVALWLLGVLTALYPWYRYRAWAGPGSIDWSDFALRGIDWAALLFYSVALVGVALRFFWARTLTIIFFSELSLVWLVGWPARGRLFYEPADAFTLPPVVAVIGLLSGKSMRQLFEDRPGRFNLWSESDSRLERVRWLIFVEVSLVTLFYGFPLVPPWGRGLAVLAGAASVAGLVGQRRWALLVSLSFSCLASALLATPASLAYEKRLPDELTGVELLTALGFAAISFVLVGGVWRVAHLLVPHPDR